MNDTILPPPPAAPESTFRMEGSPQELATLMLAIGKARANMDPVLADTTGQFKDRKFQYADLSSMYKALIPALAKEGVTVLHPNCQVSADVQRASTMIAGHGAYLLVSHDFSGEPNPDNVKGLGSMFTYLNRYQLRGLCAVAGDDDPDNDGKAATAPFKSQPKPAAPPPGNGRTRARDPEPGAAYEGKSKDSNSFPAQEPKPSLGERETPVALDDHDVDPNAPLVQGSPTSKRLADLFQEKNMAAPREKRDAFILEVTGQDVSPTGRGKLNYGAARKLIAALESRT